MTDDNTLNNNDKTAENPMPRRGRLAALAAPALMAAFTAHAAPLTLDDAELPPPPRPVTLNHETQAPDHSIRPEPRPNILLDLLASQKYLGQLMDFSSHDPKEEIEVATYYGDTLMTVAERYSGIIGGGDITEAAHSLAASNELPADIHTPLPGGTKIFVPLPPGTEIRDMTGMTGPTLSSLAMEFNQYGYLPAVLENDPVRTQKVLWELNDRVQSPESMPGPDYNYKYLSTDDFAHIQPLRGPAENSAHAHVFITEELTDNAKDTWHQETVYEYASHYAHALNPDLSSGTIHGLQMPPESLKILRSNNEIDPGHHMIFSISMAIATNQANSIQNAHRQDFISISDGTNSHIQSKNTYFLASGNSREIQGWDQTTSAFDLRLAGKAYVVGATELYPSKKLPELASYSSVAPDFVMPPLPFQDGFALRGTSFATPMAAALDAQLVRWYGGILSQEEIMAAALMTTDMNVLDKLIEGISDYTPIPFKTNGAGIPYNINAGAGMIDPQKWADTLETMAALKKELQHEPEFIEERIALANSAYTIEQDEGQNIYSYYISVPRDMTLDRLSVVLPQQQGRRADTEIISPSGYAHKIPLSLDESHATMAFAAEDVKAGDEIIIRSMEPFTTESFMVVRGYEDGNVIQMTRDRLREQGQLPEPLTDYRGGQTLESYRDAEAGIVGRILSRFKIDL